MLLIIPKELIELMSTHNVLIPSVPFPQEIRIPTIPVQSLTATAYFEKTLNPIHVTVINNVRSRQVSGENWTILMTMDNPYSGSQMLLGTAVIDKACVQPTIIVTLEVYAEGDIVLDLVYDESFFVTGALPMSDHVSFTDIPKVVRAAQETVKINPMDIHPGEGRARGYRPVHLIDDHIAKVSRSVRAELNGFYFTRVKTEHGLVRVAVSKNPDDVLEALVQRERHNENALTLSILSLAYMPQSVSKQMFMMLVARWMQGAKHGNTKKRSLLSTTSLRDDLLCHQIVSAKGYLLHLMSDTVYVVPDGGLPTAAYALTLESFLTLGLNKLPVFVTAPVFKDMKSVAQAHLTMARLLLPECVQQDVDLFEQLRPELTLVAVGQFVVFRVLSIVAVLDLDMNTTRFVPYTAEAVHAFRAHAMLNKFDERGSDAGDTYKVYYGSNSQRFNLYAQFPPTGLDLEADELRNGKSLTYVVDQMFHKLEDKLYSPLTSPGQQLEDSTLYGRTVFGLMYYRDWVVFVNTLNRSYHVCKRDSPLAHTGIDTLFNTVSAQLDQPMADILLQGHDTAQLVAQINEAHGEPGPADPVVEPEQPGRWLNVTVIMTDESGNVTEFTNRCAGHALAIERTVSQLNNHVNHNVKYTRDANGTWRCEYPTAL